MLGSGFLYSRYTRNHESLIGFGVLFALSAATTVLTLFVEPQSRQSETEILSLHLDPNRSRDEGSTKT